MLTSARVVCTRDVDLFVFLLAARRPGVATWAPRPRGFLNLCRSLAASAFDLKNVPIVVASNQSSLMVKCTGVPFFHVHVP